MSGSEALNVDPAIVAGVVLSTPYSGDAWWIGFAVFITFLFFLQMKGFARRREIGNPPERQKVIGVVLFWLLFLGFTALAMLQHHGLL